MADNPSSLVTAGAIVNDANPLPVASSSASVATNDIATNPRDLIVNGDLVSDTNPLPINLG